jgi:hypothetical protein
MLYVISGWMRSGTSMMMQALEAGGMDACYSTARDALARKRADEHYVPNPESLFELTQQEYSSQDFPRMFDGKLIKVVVAHQPAGLRVMRDGIRVIFMRRDSEEQRQSYQAFFDKAPTVEQIELQTERSLEMLKNRRDTEVNEMWFRDVIENPQLWLSKARDFFGVPLDVDAAAMVVNPKLLRYKHEDLTVGIV